MFSFDGLIWKVLIKTLEKHIPKTVLEPHSNYIQDCFTHPVYGRHLSCIYLGYFICRLVVHHFSHRTLSYFLCFNIKIKMTKETSHGGGGGGFGVGGGRGGG